MTSIESVLLNRILTMQLFRPEEITGMLILRRRGLL